MGTSFSVPRRGRVAAAGAEDQMRLRRGRTAEAGRRRPLRGGMGGTYLATTGEAGRAVLHCRMEGALDTEAYLTIRCRE